MQPHATNTAPTHQSTLALPDLYQPQYKSPAVQAQFVKMGAEEPDVMVLSTDIGHTKNFVGNTVCESGTIHSLTGDQSALCHYHKLTKPIPLSIATKCTGHRRYIGGKLSSDSNDILICSASNVPVLRATLCSSMLKWNLTPYLIETAQEADTLEQRDLTTDLTLQDCSNPGTTSQDLKILMTTLTTPDLSTGNVPDQPS
ncbi:hypothetical protein O181_006028 [Austropuccinia psidii MF-1]|uniref:Uncharacterized protein n=1 Tax=Austropuccinia psidii MF-1 TaxID=1389203 RepID=A0A9Q3GG55_9BASI|nr:hypothetical protein [Austropuccinia psidii MF-1]